MKLLIINLVVAFLFLCAVVVVDSRLYAYRRAEKQLNLNNTTIRSSITAKLNSLLDDFKNRSQNLNFSPIEGANVKRAFETRLNAQNNFRYRVIFELVVSAPENATTTVANSNEENIPIPQKYIALAIFRSVGSSFKPKLIKFRIRKVTGSRPNTIRPRSSTTQTPTTTSLYGTTNRENSSTTPLFSDQTRN